MPKRHEPQQIFILDKTFNFWYWIKMLLPTKNFLRNLPKLELEMCQRNFSSLAPEKEHKPISVSALGFPEPEFWKFVLA